MERKLAAVMAADMVGYSRLMEADEEDVLTRQKSNLQELIDPEIARYRGRIVKTTGDGMLAEFSSAQDAVRCAIDIQTGLNRREIDQDDERRIQYRVGINLGDVVFDDDDIFGDGVNVAARLEGLAEPGGICISDIVHQTVLDRLNVPFRDMGGQRVKNISRPIKVWQWTPDAAPERETPAVALKQRVQFAKSADGTQIAWASVGDGPPVFKAPNYLNHIEYEWTSPFWGPFLAEFAHSNRLIRFDQRGNGLSDWDIEKLSPEAMIEDMEAVVEAAGLERFALFGISQGAGFSVRYAIKHPDKVSCLILFNGFMRGRRMRGTVEDESYHNAAQMMIREGWGSPNPIYRNFFTSSFLTDAPQDIKDSFDELQRVSCSAENVMRIAEMNSVMDNSELAQQIRVPTLVLHITGDNQVPVSEGRLTARLIPGAQFVELPGGNHVALKGQACFDVFFEEVRAFMAEHAAN
jgi:class 3 adenylate cyclase/pimeloyl-ACP methyl ester carboxylesterase